MSKPPETILSAKIMENKLKNKQGTLVLAVFLSIAAPAFADSIPPHSADKEKDFALAKGSTDQQDFQDSFARHNTLMSLGEENGARTIAISGDLDDFRFNHHLHGKHSGNFGDGDGNSHGNGGNATGPAVSVAEPGSQTLLLIGLTGFGMFFYRRNYLRAAI